MSNTIRITKEMREMLEKFRETAITNAEKELELALLQEQGDHYIAELQEDIEVRKLTCDSCLLKNAIRYATIYFKEYTGFLNRRIKETIEEKQGTKQKFDNFQGRK